MGDIYSRDILQKLLKWIDRREIFAVVGPRQAGKTTLLLLLKEHLIRKGVSEKNIVFLNCDDFDAAEPFIRNPKAFVESYLANSKENHYFFFDEFQFIPDGGKKLKILFDAFPETKFIISGSSSLEIREKTGKYLVGRVFYFNLYPFSFGEFLNAHNPRIAQIYKEKNTEVMDFVLKDKDFTIKEDIFLKDIARLFEDYLIFGGYPEVIKTSDLETKKTILKNIFETYLNKDIIELLKITDVIKFRTIVSLLANQHANLLSLDSIASDAKSYYREVKNFLSVLEETYVLEQIRPFHKNLSTELKKNPKTYFVDAGLRNYIVKNFNPPTLREDRGKLAEGIVLSQLKHQLREEIEINYWRTLAKAEVDFVLLTGKEIVPVEVKYQSFKKPQLSRSMKNFINAYNPKRALVVTKDYWQETKVKKTIVKFAPIYYI